MSRADFPLAWQHPASAGGCPSFPANDVARSVRLARWRRRSSPRALGPAPCGAGPHPLPARIQSSRPTPVWVIPLASPQSAPRRQAPERRTVLLQAIHIPPAIVINNDINDISFGVLS